MAMSKKDFIALADEIREHNQNKQRIFGQNAQRMLFNEEQLDTLAQFCRSRNSNFMRERWLSYIAGECGPNGGPIKK